MDRDDLKHYVKIMKADVKSEKQKLKKSHKFSAGEKRVGKRARGKYYKKDKSRRRKKDKSRRRKKDKSRRRKKNKKDKLSRELLKANKKKSRKHKFRNGDGENPETFMGCWRKHVGFGPVNVVTAENDAALRHCVWTANALRHAQQQLGKPAGKSHQRGAPPGKSSGR
jgi:hypothetical protein